MSQDRREILAAAIIAADQAAAAVRKAREAAVVALHRVSGADYLRLESALRHIDRARAALRGEFTV